jgi:hypothetical protein
MCSPILLIILYDYRNDNQTRSYQSIQEKTSTSNILVLFYSLLEVKPLSFYGGGFLLVHRGHWGQEEHHSPDPVGYCSARFTQNLPTLWLIRKVVGHVPFKFHP